MTTKVARGNYPVDAVCPNCKVKGTMCEVHALMAKLPVHGVNCHGGILTAELDDRIAGAADDEGVIDSDEQFECVECTTRCSHKQMIEASLKEGGYPNLMNVSQDFKRFWAEQRKLHGSLDTEMEIVAWNAWQESRVMLGAEKGTK